MASSLQSSAITRPPISTPSPRRSSSPARIARPISAIHASSKCRSTPFFPSLTWPNAGNGSICGAPPPACPQRGRRGPTRQRPSSSWPPPRRGAVLSRARPTIRPMLPSSTATATPLPRLTPNPAIAFFGEHAVMPFGTPGGDVQSQAMLQVLLNVTVFGMDLQTAVEAPRFASYSFPNSFEPHDYLPGRLTVERNVGDKTLDALAALGHDVKPWPERSWHAGSVCAVLHDRKEGVWMGAADPRRSSYAVGW